SRKKDGQSKDRLLVPRSQSLFGNAFPGNSVSCAGRARETEFREQPFPNRVWERGKSKLLSSLPGGPCDVAAVGLGCPDTATGDDAGRRGRGRQSQDGQVVRLGGLSRARQLWQRRAHFPRRLRVDRGQPPIGYAGPSGTSCGRPPFAGESCHERAR